MPHSRYGRQFWFYFAWMNNVLMNISGTKRNSKFSNGENLDIFAERF